jgi:hypothetical protein
MNSIEGASRTEYQSREAIMTYEDATLSPFPKTVRPLFTGHSFREGLAPVYLEIEIVLAHDQH